MYFLDYKSNIKRILAFSPPFFFQTCTWKSKIQAQLDTNTMTYRHCWDCVSSQTKSSRYRSTECPELEGTHKDHRAQPPALHSTTQHPNPTSECSVQEPPELWGLWPCPLPWAACARAKSDHAVQHQPSPANYWCSGLSSTCFIQAF